MLNKIMTSTELKEIAKRYGEVVVEIKNIKFYVRYVNLDKIHDYYLGLKNVCDVYVVLMARSTIEDIHMTLTGINDETDDFEKQVTTITNNDNN